MCVCADIHINIVIVIRAIVYGVAIDIFFFFYIFVSLFAIKLFFTPFATYLNSQLFSLGLLHSL